MFDVLLKGGLVVDASQGLCQVLDLAIENDQIALIDHDIESGQAATTTDVSGHLVLPGLVDTHVHLSGPFGDETGYRMLVKAGVTCALDLAGDPGRTISGIRRHGVGITTGFLYPVIPGDTVSSSKPARAEFRTFRDNALRQGALGFKLLGGHYPISPDATASAISVAREERCYCAIHVGTTVNGSNIDGLTELFSLTDGNPVHVAHINSYCRGQVRDVLSEVSHALDLIGAAPAVRSESYLSIINAGRATVVDGIPQSEVVKTSLRMGGYDATEAGLVHAIEDGYAQVQAAVESETVLLPPQGGLKHFRDEESRVRVSFPVNSPIGAIALALTKRNGSYVIDALATDGGTIPRNTTLAQGLALVQFGALSLVDFVRKACLEPARMLGLPGKGRIEVGADADIVVADPASRTARLVIAGGRIVLDGASVLGSGGTLLTSLAGQRHIASEGLKYTTVAPAWLQ